MPEKNTPRHERVLGAMQNPFWTILTDPKTRTGSGLITMRETSRTVGNGPWDVEVDGAAYESPGMCCYRLIKGTGEMKKMRCGLNSC